jgi:DNA-binding CsgD family transcriptional regulator
MMFGVILNSMACVTYIYFGAYIVTVDSKSKANLFFFLTCMIFSLWSFSYIFINIPDISPADEALWRQIGYTAAVTYEPAIMLMALHFTGYIRRIKNRPVFILLIIIISVFLLYKNWAENAIAANLATGIWHLALHIYAFIYNATTIILFIIKTVKTNSRRIRLQVKIIVTGAVIAIAATIFTDYYMPSIGFPTLTPVLLIIWIGSVWYALVRHRFLSLNYNFISTIVMDKIDEIILILDSDFKITAVNNKFFDLINLSPDTIRNRPVFDFTEEPVLKTSLNRLLKNREEKSFSLKLNLNTSDDNPVLIDTRLQAIRDRYGDFLGILFMGKEIKGLMRLKKIYGISSREIDIIRYAIAGSTNRQIAGLLQITEGTVKVHLTNIYNKLGIDNKVQLQNVVLEG